eukprot:g14956.t1
MKQLEKDDASCTLADLVSIPHVLKTESRAEVLDDAETFAASTSSEQVMASPRIQSSSSEKQEEAEVENKPNRVPLSGRDASKIGTGHRGESSLSVDAAGAKGKRSFALKSLGQLGEDRGPLNFAVYGISLPEILHKSCQEAQAKDSGLPRNDAKCQRSIAVECRLWG